MVLAGRFLGEEDEVGIRRVRGNVVEQRAAGGFHGLGMKVVRHRMPGVCWIG